MSLLVNPIEAPTSEAFSYLDQKAAERAMQVLFDHYPGHDWMVTVHSGMMYIRSMNLSSNWGWRQRMEELDPSPEGFDQPIMRAGGEILERFGLPTRKLDVAVYSEIPRDLRGAPKGEFD